MDGAVDTIKHGLLTTVLIQSPMPLYFGFITVIYMKL